MDTCPTAVPAAGRYYAVPAVDVSPIGDRSCFVLRRPRPLSMDAAEGTEDGMLGTIVSTARRAQHRQVS